MLVVQMVARDIRRSASHVKAYHWPQICDTSPSLTLLSRSREAYNTSSRSAEDSLGACEFVQRRKSAITLHEEDLHSAVELIVKSLYEAG